MAEKPWFVYVIGYSKLGPVKVGITHNPYKRLQQLQTAHHEPLKFFHCEFMEDRKQALAVEEKFHSIEDEFRLKGEWFSLAPDSAIENLKDYLSFVEMEEEERSIDEWRANYVPGGTG